MRTWINKDAIAYIVEDKGMTHLWLKNGSCISVGIAYDDVLVDFDIRGTKTIVRNVKIS